MGRNTCYNPFFLTLPKQKDMEDTNINDTFETLFGIPSLQSLNVKKAETDQLQSVLQAIGDSDKKTKCFFVDNFSILQQHIDKYRQDLEEILEMYFPNRWEIKEQPTSIDELDRIEKWINKHEFKNRNNSEKFMEELIRLDGYYSTHNFGKKIIIIQFPPFVITNSNGHKHTIKGLWMKFKYNYIYRLMSMGGIRSLKTYSEYETSYNHSHMSSSSTCEKENWLSCCLGGTDYSTLNVALRNNFDTNDTTLFFQQLSDYLAWESLEGGPYVLIESIGNRNYNSRINYLNNSQINTAYQDFLIKFPSDYNVELVDNGVFYTFKVIKDEEFKKKVAEICPENFLQLYDTITKRQYVDNTNNININTIERIKQLNNNYKNNSNYKLFNFKGEDIYFQIEEPNNSSSEVINPHIVKMAPQSLIDAIAIRLEQGINAFFIEKFTKEIKI